MIMSTAELRGFIDTDKSDTVLGLMIDAAESFIKKYTNNDFVSRTTDLTEYPPDVQLGVVNMIRWDLQNRDKVGVSSETISRHSVTYFDQSSANAVGGYPIALVSFLQPYMRARF